jgi:soluble lytic murein transglycosylase-like protein
MKRAVAAIAIVASSVVVVARADCIDKAAAYQGLDASLVRAIADHESHMNASAVNHNPDGSEDLGVMQINSRELTRLGQYGITRESLFDECVNVFVGAQILRRKINRFGPTWKAVGAYNATSPDKQVRYANEISIQLSRNELRARAQQ